MHQHMLGQKTSADTHACTDDAGVLTDDAPAGPSGILVDIGDTLGGSISRADVASLCVEALLSTDAKVRA